MKLILTIIFAIQIGTCFSQIDFDSDSIKAPIYPEITQKIKKLNTNFDFQLRFWSYRQGWVFVMTMRDNNWCCQSYNFSFNKKKKIKIKKNNIIDPNCDSIWNYLVANNVLNLPDMELIEKDMYITVMPELVEKETIDIQNEEFLPVNSITNDATVIKQTERKLRHLIADGGSYSLELLKGNKYKRIVYRNPVAYAEIYKNVEELQEMSNIIQFIYEILNIENQPN